MLRTSLELISKSSKVTVELQVARFSPNPPQRTEKLRQNYNKTTIKRPGQMSLTRTIKESFQLKAARTGLRSGLDSGPERNLIPTGLWSDADSGLQSGLKPAEAGPSEAERHQQQQQQQQRLNLSAQIKQRWKVFPVKSRRSDCDSLQSHLSFSQTRVLIHVGTFHFGREAAPAEMS
ncbi:uncharacterized protein V6R79_019572 [Siganus canaliculatus]